MASQRSPTFLLDGNLMPQGEFNEDEFDDRSEHAGEEGVDYSDLNGMARGLYNGLDLPEEDVNMGSLGRRMERDEEQSAVRAAPFDDFFQTEEDSEAELDWMSGFEKQESQQPQGEQQLQAEADDSSGLMPETFYHQVENFLNRRAPSLSAPTDDKKHKVAVSKTSAGSSNGDRRKTAHKNVQSSGYGSQPSKKRVMASTQQQQQAVFNADLLQEAFAYTQRISEMHSTAEEEMEMEELVNKDSRAFNAIKQARGSGSAGASGGRTTKLNAAYGGSMDDQRQRQRRGLQGAASSKGLVKKLRSQTSVKNISSKAPNPNSFETTATSEPSSQHTNKLDFDALVSNFEQGLTLRKLQQDLQESKQSMSKSENFVRQLTKEFGPVVNRRGLRPHPK